MVAKKTSGFIAKRLFVPEEVNKKVFKHLRKMQLRSDLPLKWEDAANDLLSKATKNIES